MQNQGKDDIKSSQRDGWRGERETELERERERGREREKIHFLTSNEMTVSTST